MRSIIALLLSSWCLPLHLWGLHLYGLSLCANLGLSCWRFPPFLQLIEFKFCQIWQFAVMIPSNTLQLHGLPFIYLFFFGGDCNDTNVTSLVGIPPEPWDCSHSPVYFLPVVQAGVPFVLLPLQRKEKVEEWVEILFSSLWNAPSH